MMRRKALILGLAAPLLLSCCNKTPTESEQPYSGHGINLGETLIIFDKNSQIDGGEIVSGNIHFRFDERSVNEHPADSFIEIGAYGSLYLESYVPGLMEARVIARHTTDYTGSFFLGRTSTPNSVEFCSLYSETSSFVNLSANQPFFSIHNHGNNTLIIDEIRLSFEPTSDPEGELKELLTVFDKEVPYRNGITINPYEEIDESKIPSNRIVKRIDEGRTYNAPGQYTYGYEIYSKKRDGSIGKMLYSITAELTIKGGVNGNHLAVFHLPNDKISVLECDANGRFNIEDDPELLKYNWEATINNFVTPLTSDRHFYPQFSVVGIPTEKDADGCLDVYSSYSLFDGVVDIEDPVMQDGYRSGGWFLDSTLETPFDKYGKYESDLTLYAKCIETDKDFRKVYYFDYDGTFPNKADYLYEDTSLNLLRFGDVRSVLGNNGTLTYEVRVGPNRLAMLMPENDYRNEYGTTIHYQGDPLDYGLVKDTAGDIDLYVSRFDFYQDGGPAQFSQLFEDIEHNTVINAIKMNEQYHEGDFILPGRYYDDSIHGLSSYRDAYRSGEFLITDEVHGYIVDQGSYDSVSTYAYGNKDSLYSKPLDGILRHDSVLKVGRRAFFNRYGLKGTYFPKYAREFDIESYANTHFNETLLLPKNLIKIGNRAFMGSKNIKYVALPATLKTVGKGAFSLGEYDKETFSFGEAHYRNDDEKIIFYYEGSESDFEKLDEATKSEITLNASEIVYGFSYNPYYGK